MILENSPFNRFSFNFVWPSKATKQRTAMDLPQGLRFRFVWCERYLLSIANFLQIITPCVLATGLFSMPQTVVPFKLNPSSFAIVIFVIMGVLRLLFFLQDVLLHRPRWWKIITALMKIITWSEVIDRLLAGIYGSALTRKRFRNCADGTTDSREMENCEVWRLTCIVGFLFLKSDKRSYSSAQVHMWHIVCFWARYRKHKLVSRTRDLRWRRSSWSSTQFGPPTIHWFWHSKIGIDTSSNDVDWNIRSRFHNSEPSCPCLLVSPCGHVQPGRAISE